MLSLTTVFLFSITSILLALTPGPDMLYIATRSIAQGRSAGIVSVLGVHTGVFIHTIAAVLGISALIEASAVAFNFVRFAGAAYLIYLGIHAFLSKAETLEVKTVEHKKLRNIFYQGLITNLLNPKVILFFLAFFPQFVDPSKGNVPFQLVLLGVILVVVSLPIDIGISLLSGIFGKWLKARKGTQQAGKWITGSVFISLGISTAVFGARKF